MSRAGKDACLRATGRRKTNEIVSVLLRLRTSLCAALRAAFGCPILLQAKLSHGPVVVNTRKLPANKKKPTTHLYRGFELKPGSFSHGWLYAAEAKDGRERRPTFINWQDTAT